MDTKSESDNCCFSILLAILILFALFIASIPLLAGMGGRHPKEGDFGLFLRVLPCATMVGTFVVYYLITMISEKKSLFKFLRNLAIMCYVEIIIFYFVLMSYFKYTIGS